MHKITKKEYEDLCIYISFIFLSTKSVPEHGFLYGDTFYIVKIDEENTSIIVPKLQDKDRFSFIKEFATFSLVCLFEECKPEEGYFIFTSAQEGEYYLTTVNKEKMSVKKISTLL